MGNDKKCAGQWRIGDECQKYLFEGVIVPMALYGAEAWGMRSAEREGK